MTAKGNSASVRILCVRVHQISKKNKDLHFFEEKEIPVLAIYERAKQIIAVVHFALRATRRRREQGNFAVLVLC